jgi:hypothetical protein
VSDYYAPLAVQSGWPLVAAGVLAVLIGVLRLPGYSKVLGIAVVEVLLIVWVLSLSRLP